MARIYRDSYDLYISCGILFNHESRYRDMRYITQKVTYGAACAKCGVADSPELNEEGESIVKSGKLAVGNLAAARDWGFAGDYVQAMWLMLQPDRPEDFVVGTGVLRTVSQLCETAYRLVGLDWRDHVVSDPRFVRLLETGATVANAGKARQKLGWHPMTSYEDMLKDMIAAHLERLNKPA